MILLRLIKISVYEDQHDPIWLNDNTVYEFHLYFIKLLYFFNIILATLFYKENNFF